MNIVHVVEKDDVTLRVWVEFSEGRGALLKIHGASFKDVHEWQPFGGAQAGAAIMHNAIGSNVFCGNLVHTTTARNRTQNINVAYIHSQHEQTHD